MATAVSSSPIHIEQSERPTIMSGKVVTFATSFRQEDGLIGMSDVAQGPFEVSVSRDAVIVHHADCRTPESVDALIEALRLAKEQFPRLRSPRNGYEG